MTQTTFLICLLRLFSYYLLCTLALIQIAYAESTHLTRQNFLKQNSGERIPAYDAAFERFGSYFYLIGTGTKGGVWQSEDLISWQENPDMLTMKYPAQWVNNPAFKFTNSKGYSIETYPRFGAGGLFIWNGIALYAFNGMAQSYTSIDDFESGIKNSFIHASQKYPHSRGIDPEYFVDKMGQLYYLRKVNALEPHPITGIKQYAAPATLIAKAETPLQPEHEILKNNPDGMRLALWGEKGEAFYYDKTNFEGPKLYFARDKYYLFFVGNVMSARIGQYQTGAAIADTVDALDNSKKSTLPIIGRNFEQQLADWEVILPTSEHGSQSVFLTTQKPKNNKWYQANHQLSSKWRVVNSAIGFPLKDRNVAIRGLHTPWRKNIETLYIRRDFQLKSLENTTLLRYRFEGSGDIRLNGKVLKTFKSQQMNSYANIEIPSALLKKGKNVIAIKIKKSKDKKDFSFIDTGVYIAAEGFQDDITGFSQPNLFRGLNGFEYWMGGKAFYNGVSGQGIERVYFLNDKVLIDPATGTRDTNFPVLPALPKLVDRADLQTDKKLNRSNPIWQTNGQVIYRDKQFSISTNSTKVSDVKDSLDSQQNITSAMAWLKPSIANHQHYYFHTAIRFSDKATDKSGVILWRVDQSNYATARFDKIKKQLQIELVLNDIIVEEKIIPLPESFQFISDDPRIAALGTQKRFFEFYKNGQNFRFKLDMFTLNAGVPVQLTQLPNQAGQAGVLSTSARTQFDDIIFNPGFEDWDKTIFGWQSTGKYQVQQNGLELAQNTTATKGDWLNNLEFNVRMTHQKPFNQSGQVAISLNYQDGTKLDLSVDINSKLWQLTFKDKMMASAYAQKNRQLGFKATGETQNIYTFNLDKPSYINGFKVLWNTDNNAFLNTHFKLPHTNDLSVQANLGQQKVATNVSTHSAPQNGHYQYFAFDKPQLVDQLILGTNQNDQRPFSFVVDEQLSLDNHIVLIRQNAKVRIWINQKLIFEIDDPNQKSKANIGLSNQKQAVIFNDISVFERF